MKKTITAALIATALISCNNSKEEAEKEFISKLANHLNVDTANLHFDEAATQRTVDSMNAVLKELETQK